jgi:chromosome segregation ATPase
MREAVKIHEAIIHHAGEAVTHLYEMGRQLKAMRDGKYYIHLGYESFGQYVEENGDYSFKERQAYKYIKIVETYSDKFIAENQGLGIERLEMLTALGERDAAELVESTDLAGMTTAEVKQLIKEKQGLGEQLSLLTEELEAAGSEKEKIAAKKQQALEEAEKKIKDLEKKIKAEKKKSKESIGEKDGEIMLLKEQLSSATPSAEQIEKIKNEANAEHQKEISAIKAEYEAKLSAAEDKMSAIEKKTRSADEAERRAALKVYFEETQKNVSAFIEKIRSLEDKTERDKYRSGAIKWLEAIAQQLKGDTEV